MVKIINILLATYICFQFYSCEQKLDVYPGEENNVSGIYFFSIATKDLLTGNPTSYSDSIFYNFQNENIDLKQKTINVPVQIIGKTSNQDRTFIVKTAGGSAMEGEDYVGLPDTYTLPAGKSSINVPIQLLRTSKLLKQDLTLDLQLVENENFKFLMPYLFNISNNQKMDATKFRIRFSEIFQEPGYYRAVGTSSFGKYSATKLKLINDLMGWKVGDWAFAGTPGSIVSYGKFAFAANLVKIYLEEKVSEKDPVYDEDGTYMQLGPAYTVDYSKL